MKTAFPALSIILIVLVAAIGGCGPGPAADRGNEVLTVAAATDLQFAFTDIGRLFEEKTGARVTFSFGSSGTLAQQIENGAPVDLFASADEEYVERLISRGSALPGSAAQYAVGRIALVTYRGSNLTLTRLYDLLRPEVRKVSIANPEHAPYGRAARQALTNAGLWEQVQPKLVYGENVRQALQFVETGNAEAGIVALSIADVPRVSRVVVDDALYQPLNQTMVIVKGAKQESLARDFIAFVNGPKGRPVMQRYGFLLPGEG
ncbi:MAG TPA: molybdate ABC transporter substrate-binding protein [Chloroflexota bacterium]|nr:molybdate ABC transporter substrate-binding protein [Chloroflexota bacterium]